MRTIGRDEVRPAGLAISAESAHIGKMSKDRATLRVEVKVRERFLKNLKN
jgi:hypothetical protein